METETPVSSVSRGRDCFITLIAGMLLFLLALTAGSTLFEFGRISISTLLLTAFASAAAAGTAAGFLPLDKLPRAVGLPMAGKIGGRTGLRTAFLVAGMSVLGAHLGGTASPFLIWLPGVLSIMPGALAGI